MEFPDVTSIVYPDGELRRSFRLRVAPRHELHVEESGNPDGVPIVLLHGGPGGRIAQRHRQLVDPRRYRVVAFDQRGAGRSTPAALVDDNTTWDLVADIERIREHLGISRWHVAGGSWGSTLALVYAQSHPQRVSALCVWSIWLADRTTQRWLFDFGANMIYPEAWDRFVAHFPLEDLDDLESATYRRIRGDDPVAAERVARALGAWETASVSVHPRHTSLAEEDDDGGAGYGRIMAHYFENDCFLDGDDHIVSRCDSLAPIPAMIVHGRFDMCTPLSQAWRLAKAWPGADLRIVEHGGHMPDEPAMATAIVAALDELAGIDAV